jgi:hypothetical protein
MNNQNKTNAHAQRQKFASQADHQIHSACKSIAFAPPMSATKTISKIAETPVPDAPNFQQKKTIIIEPSVLLRAKTEAPAVKVLENVKQKMKQRCRRRQRLEDAQNLPLTTQLLGLSLGFGHRRGIRRSSAASDDATDDLQSLFGVLVAILGRADVPHVGFQRVAAAADAHFCEVADCVFGFWHT